MSKGLTSDAISDYARRFGLGSTTGLGLTGESAGRVPDRRWKWNRFQESWLTGDTLNYVIGQGWLTVTPLQMAAATAAVANGGFLPQPHLVRRILWPAWTGFGVQELSAPEVRQVDVSGDVLTKVRAGMRLAVESPQGTAHGMSDLGISVAAKTGSAESVPGHPAHAWFVCYAPAEQPRYAVCVFVAEGGHGGTTAAPVAHSILASAFHVKPATPSTPTESD